MMLEPLGKKYGIDPKHRRDVSIFFGEPQAGLGAAIRSSMRREGFADVRVFASLPALTEAIDAGEPDIVLLDGEMPGGDACAFVRDLREGRLGRNPFLATIVTAWRPTQAMARGVADSGSDDLLVKPNSPDQFLVRMSALAHRRRPFVVTSDYIGPDRRPGEDPDLPRFDVPNTLRAKALGEPLDAFDLERAIERTRRQVNEERLRRHAIQVGQLVGLLVPAYRGGRADAETLAGTRRLLSVAEDAALRLQGTRYEPVAEICATLRAVAQAVLRAFPDPGRKELDLLPRLAEAMMVGFDSGRGATRLAGEISSSVGRYLETKAPAG